MAKPIWKPLPKNHPIFKEGRFYTYTPKKPHKLNKEENNLINASKKEKEVEKWVGRKLTKKNKIQVKMKKKKMKKSK